MELTAQDKNLLRCAMDQLWRKGCNNIAEAAVGTEFTLLIQRLVLPPPAAQTAIIPEKKE